MFFALTCRIHRWRHKRNVGISAHFQRWASWDGATGDFQYQAPLFLNGSFLYRVPRAAMRGALLLALAWFAYFARVTALPETSCFWKSVAWRGGAPGVGRFP